MEIDISEVLRDQPVVLLFLIIGLGYMVGKINVKGFELGSAGGVLFAALGLGHLGYSLPAFIETIGFVFFIYSVGFQAGPRFVSAFKRDGVRYGTLALIIGATGLGLAVLADRVFDLAPGYAAGIMGGAMTSTPTMAAAQDTVAGGTLSFDGFSLEQVNSNITVGYAITYVFGLVGLILFMRLFPKMAGIDLKAAAARAREEMNIPEGDEEEGGARGGVPAVRTFEVVNGGVAGKALCELDILRDTGCLVLEIRRGDQHIAATPEIVLERGDVVAVAGTLDQQMGLIELFGPPLGDRALLSKFPVVTQRLVVNRKEAVGKTLRQLSIIGKHGCFVSRFEREGVAMDVDPDVRLEKGDILAITGIKARTDRVIDELGNLERPIYETDLLTFAFGIVIGVIVGMITIKVGNLPIGVGMSGGLLITGLLVGYLRSRHHTFGRVPAAARFILMELGILFFLAGVGLRAGHGLLDGLRSAGWQIFVSGVLITVVPVVIGFLVGRLVFKMNPAILLGSLTGAMTSTPSLSIVNEAAGSTVPALGYAGAYAIANILLTVLGQLIVRIT